MGNIFPEAFAEGKEDGKAAGSAGQEDLFPTPMLASPLPMMPMGSMGSMSMRPESPYTRRPMSARSELEILQDKMQKVEAELTNLKVRNLP